MTFAPDTFTLLQQAQLKYKTQGRNGSLNRYPYVRVVVTTYYCHCRAIRYEDLCMDPYNHLKDLFKFFGLYFHRAVREFLDSHTKKDVGGVSSTSRDTKSAPFHWRADLNFSEVQYIEENCDQAMKLWGYIKASNESHLREFHPLTYNSIE